MLKFTRRGFMAIASMLALSGCGGGSSEEKPAEETEPEAEPEPIVTEETHYDVFRADIQKGVTGDVEAVTSDTQDFSDSYAVLMPDGSFTFEINGVPYSGTLTLGGPDHHLYSGIENADVTRLLFDGDKFANVGSVDIEGFTVDDYLLIQLTTTVDSEWTQITFYLWEHVEE